MHSADESEIDGLTVIRKLRENNIKTIWANGGTVINGWLAIPSSISAELMALQDWDSVCIDMQHGAIGYETAITAQWITRNQVFWPERSIFIATH